MLNLSCMEALVSIGHADLAITKSGPANATAGTDITYTIGVTNNGPGENA